MSPPALAAEHPETARRAASGTTKKSYRVKVVNSPLNGNGKMRRRDAEYYVATGRAEWLDDEAGQLRLIASHPLNQAAAERAAAGYTAVNRLMTVAEMRHVPIACPDVALGRGRRGGRPR